MTKRKLIHNHINKNSMKTDFIKYRNKKRINEELKILPI